MQAWKVALYFFLGTVFLNATEEENVFQWGESLASEGLYLDALACYQQASSQTGQEDSHLHLLLLRQALCYLELNRPQEALSTLKEAGNPPSSPEQLYLTAVAYRQLGDYAQALKALEALPSSFAAQASEVELEKGVALFNLQRLTEAQSYLESISWQAEKPHLYALSRLYLIRMFLLQENHKSAQTHLSLLDEKLPESHSLHYEKHELAGRLFFAKGEYEQAASSFEKALPPFPCSHCKWKKPTLVYLITSYLKWAEQNFILRKPLDAIFSKAYLALEELLADSKEEASYLLLTDFYLTQARFQQDKNAYRHIQDLIARSLFQTPHGRCQAQLKCAAAAPSYQERVRLYEQLINAMPADSVLQGEIWYHKGLNDFEEGLALQKDPLLLQSSEHLLEQASEALAHAHQLFLLHTPAQAALALKLQSLAYFHQPSDQKKKQSLERLQKLLLPPLQQTLKEPEEAYALIGLVAAEINSLDEDALQQTENVLKEGLTLASASVWKERLLKIMGKFYLQHQHWTQARVLFDQFLQDYPHSLDSSEVLYWRAECAGKLGDLAQRKNDLQQIYLNDPQSPFAPSAYFHFYSYRDYMRGHRRAIKHLQAMPALFKNHPLLISAYYLIGLDCMKDHLSEEGSLLRSKNEIAAIDAFQLAESTFDELAEKNEVPPDSLAYFMQVRYLSMLERAQANLAIAEASQGGKKQIYLDYAEGVFQDLQRVFHSPSPLVDACLIKQEAYPKILEESEFWLACCYLKHQKREEANALFNHMLDHYRQAHIQHGYLLSRVWYEKGMVAQQQKDYALALQHLFEAEKAAEAKPFLSPDQKLDLWIQQALCYKELKQWDEAMRLLSKAVNDEALSSQRVKAMYLRAEIYALEGRPELALKQLEATSKKGGEWGKKAKTELEQNYGL
ncbi:tetratricopeptide repeat protein [Candidatus Protochlamydia phocaeensis]|uniref:tetratricopeptide repeat protein n=1 Tax=Candidatus Protochlamydia phocaeensis TaxID=1414722 RepID=UPI000837B605|nr:tetratricopeptide repeat protein [Candidatus Protochlamydia phocaeensis]